MKVLIADDSVVYRSQIRAALTQIPGLEVVSAVSNGKLAIATLQAQPVDLVILDLEMPEMDGLETLREISRLKIKTRVLVFSSVSKHGADITLEALKLGAFDFITKPGPDGSESPADKIRKLIEPKLAMVAPRAAAPAQASVNEAPRVQMIWDLFKPKVIVIGSSTGGPTVLEQLFSRIQYVPLVPVLIVQHMPPLFTASLADRLAKVSGLTVHEAKHGQVVKPGEVYLAPGDFHMTVAGSKEMPVIQLDQGPTLNSVRPAVDKLFQSVSEIYSERTLGIVLTGMGSDGKIGCQEIKKRGGGVVIQDQASCAVFGMPGAVYEAGAYDRMLTPMQITDLLQEKALGSTASLGVRKNA